MKFFQAFEVGKDPGMEVLSCYEEPVVVQDQLLDVTDIVEGLSFNGRDLIV